MIELTAFVRVFNPSIDVCVCPCRAEVDARLDSHTSRIGVRSTRERAAAHVITTKSLLSYTGQQHQLTYDQHPYAIQFPGSARRWICRRACGENAQV